MCVLLEKILGELLYPCYFKLCKEKQDEKMRDIRTRKAVKNIFKFVYFTAISFAGWYTLKDSYALPQSLGGKGELMHSFKNFPYVQLPPYYRIYFASTMGYHV